MCECIQPRIPSLKIVLQFFLAVLFLACFTQSQAGWQWTSKEGQDTPLPVCIVANPLTSFDVSPEGAQSTTWTDDPQNPPKIQDLDPSWAKLRPSWTMLGQVGTMLELCWPMLAHLGAMLGYVGQLGPYL